MQSTDFVRVYQREINNITPELTSEENIRFFHEAQRWGSAFGNALHDYLSGRPPTAMDLTKASAYQTWSERIFNQHFTIFDGTLEDAELRARTSFHALNRTMIDHWTPVIDKDGQWPKDKRNFLLQITQDKLAVEAVSYFIMREEYFKSLGGISAIEDPETAKKYRLSSGTLEEFDAALAIIHAMRYGDALTGELTVVPGPPQFEAASQSSQNADLLVIDPARKYTVGVQVKTQVHNYMRGKVDPGRIVLIDGNVDLENVTAARVSSRHSDKKVIPWPGIIAAHKLLEIDLRTKNNKGSPIIKLLLQRQEAARRQQGSTDVRTNRRYAMSRAADLIVHIKNMQHFVRTAMGGMTLNMDRISARIGERIADRLYSD